MISRITIFPHKYVTLDSCEWLLPSQKRSMARGGILPRPRTIRVKGSGQGRVELRLLGRGDGGSLDVVIGF